MHLEKYFSNMINHDNMALEADLVCSCGCDQFYITHTGIQKNSLFGSISLRKKEGQLVIKAKCSSCGNTFTVMNSTSEGKRPSGKPSEDFVSFEIKGHNVFGINVKYNFLEENFMTDQYEMILIDFFTNTKTYRVYED